MCIYEYIKYLGFNIQKRNKKQIGSMKKDAPKEHFKDLLKHYPDMMVVNLRTHDWKLYMRIYSYSRNHLMSVGEYIEWLGFIVLKKKAIFG